MTEQKRTFTFGDRVIVSENPTWVSGESSTATPGPGVITGGPDGSGDFSVSGRTSTWEPLGTGFGYVGPSSLRFAGREPEPATFSYGDRVTIAEGSTWSGGTSSGLVAGPAKVISRADSAGDYMVRADTPNKDRDYRDVGFVRPADLALLDPEPAIPSHFQVGDLVIVAEGAMWSNGRTTSRIRPGPAKIIDGPDLGGDFYLASEMDPGTDGFKVGHAAPRYLSPAIEKTGPVEPWEPVSEDWEPTKVLRDAEPEYTLGTVGELHGRVEALTESLRKAEAWKAELIRDAHEYANDGDLCEAFDDFMENHGLPRRASEYRVDVRVVTAVTVYVEARDEADAMEKAKDKAVDEIDDGVTEETEIIDITVN